MAQSTNQSSNSLRSIPEAGYITLGTLRYGVRLSSGVRLSEGLSCRNSDSLDTCSVSTTRCQRPKAESPGCGNCCVALTNGRCCDGSPCFESSAPPSNSVQERRRRHQWAKSTHNSPVVTRLPFRKCNYLCVPHFCISSYTLGEGDPRKNCTYNGTVPIYDSQTHSVGLGLSRCL